MRAQDSIREVEMITRLGVEVRCGVQIGRDLPLQNLEKDFDAIFIGIGLGETDDLQIPGEDLSGCQDALSFIEQTKIGALGGVTIGRKVAVIGGGNTAIDAATAAKRLGADEVYMIYRRSREEMSAFKYEYELAKGDAVTFIWQAAPVRIIAGNGKIAALECVRTRLGATDASGRRAPEPIPGSEFRLEVEMVIKALGQKKKIDFLKSIPGLQLDRGRVVVSAETMQTSNAKYYAGGDCVNGGAEVVDAVAQGKRAARGIHAAFTARQKGVAHA
jgi:glutamate synthase (NADPH/NADH) small chain